MPADVIDFGAIRFMAEIASRVPELEDEWPLFVDWLTIRQPHEGGGLPLVCDGVRTDVDKHGEIVFETIKRDRLEGSFDSTMWLKCDGNVVEFHGNIARWSRPDNVFGYGWDETIRRVNALLRSYGLPPFTKGERHRYADSGVVWINGARCSRIDLTVNYASFSESNAQRVIDALAQHRVGRQTGVVSPDRATVMYGYGSKYISGKVYLKHAELEAHRKRKSGQHVDQQVIDWCKGLGMLREEFTLKSRFLTQTGLCWLGEIDGAQLYAVYRGRSQFRRFREMEVKDTSALSAGARGTLARYEQGEPHGLSRRTFYRHRSEILNVCGIDISVPRKVEKVVFPVKVIEVQPLVAPEWYRRKYG